MAKKRTKANSLTDHERKKTSQAAFLKAFVERGTVLGASDASGIHRDTHYHWLKTDTDYAQAYAMAEEEAVQMLETEIRRRALVGVDEPVWHQGKRVGYVKKYSDTLAIFILKARRPDVYRERFEGTITNVDLTDLTDDELATIRTVMARQAQRKAARLS